MQAAKGAGRLVAARGQDMELRLWVENDIAGRPLTDPIFEHINQCDILFADVTTVNFNVTFEIGYAVGLGKRIYITRNTNFRRETELIDKIGIFDTLGFDSYSNEEDLAAILIGASSGDAIRLAAVINAKAPIYVLNTPTTGQAMLAIVSRIKKARLGFRNFFPQEEPRLSAIKAVDDVSAALGVDRSLMRPRNLLQMLVHCRGFAVNLGRERIEQTDIEKGLKAYSLDLITEADQELTDIIGSDTALLYHFIGEGDEFDRTRLKAILKGAEIPEDRIDSVIEFLLYYGFLGIKVGGETARYIFDVGYDMKLMRVLISKNEQALSYVLNPAFYPGLNL
jgi:hypothetical protein